MLEKLFSSYDVAPATDSPNPSDPRRVSDPQQLLWPLQLAASCHFLRPFQPSELPATSSGVQRAKLPASRTAKAERTCHQTLTTRPSTFSDSGHELGMVLVASPRMPSREDLAAFAAAVGMS